MGTFQATSRKTLPQNKIYRQKPVTMVVSAKKVNSGVLPSRVFRQNRLYPNFPPLCPIIP